MHLGIACTTACCRVCTPWCSEHATPPTTRVGVCAIPGAARTLVHAFLCALHTSERARPWDVCTAACSPWCSRQLGAWLRAVPRAMRRLLRAASRRARPCAAQCASQHCHPAAWPCSAAARVGVAASASPGQGGQHGDEQSSRGELVVGALLPALAAGGVGGPFGEAPGSIPCACALVVSRKHKSRRIWV